MMGDFNVKVGSARAGFRRVVDPHGMITHPESKDLVMSQNSELVVHGTIAGPAQKNTVTCCMKEIDHVLVRVR